MKFKEYVKNLNELLKERPETGNYEVVSSRDDEGNGYNLVHYGPTVGEYEEEDKEFRQELKPNAVCIN